MSDHTLYVESERSMEDRLAEAIYRMDQEMASGCQPLGCQDQGEILIEALCKVGLKIVPLEKENE